MIAPKPFEEQLMWTPEKGVLMAACMKAERSTTNPTQISANDCINGTLVDESRLPAHYMNFTYLWALFEESQTYKPDPELPPPQSDLVIYNSSRLLINLDVGHFSANIKLGEETWLLSNICVSEQTETFLAFIFILCWVFQRHTAPHQNAASYYNA